MSARSYAQVSGANDDLRVAVVGFAGRGDSHIGAFSSMKGVRLVSLCDVDRSVLDKEVAKLTKKIGAPVQGFQDVRKLLESKDLDILSIATPNHWHALNTIWAVQTGRDVYVEKPVSHNVWEGRQSVAAARKHNRIVQTGTQSRSSRRGIGEAVRFINEGNLGKITLARGLCYKPRKSIGKADKPFVVPDSIDFDSWVGPADKAPITRSRLHYDWHWVKNTGNGDLGNQGIHQMDICRWFLGEMALAPEVVSIGGRVGYVDDGTTANTQIVFQNYAKAPLLFEVRGLETAKYQGAGVGCVIHCEGGYVVVPSYTEAAAYDKDGKELKRWKGADDHFKNFISAVRSRKVEDLHADILEGHLSSALCHTGNISLELGKQGDQEAVAEAAKSNAALAEATERMIQHLVENKVDLSASQLTIGQPLKMDPAKEIFTGASCEAANKMLTRNYRSGYVVPEIV